MQTQSYIILAIPENLLDLFLLSYIDDRGIRINHVGSVYRIRRDTGSWFFFRTVPHGFTPVLSFVLFPSLMFLPAF